MAGGRQWFLWGFLVRQIRWFARAQLSLSIRTNQPRMLEYSFTLWWKLYGSFLESVGRADSREHQRWEPTPYTIFERNGTTLRRDVRKSTPDISPWASIFPILTIFQFLVFQLPKKPQVGFPNVWREDWKAGSSGLVPISNALVSFWRFNKDRVVRSWTEGDLGACWQVSTGNLYDNRN